MADNYGGDEHIVTAEDATAAALNNAHPACGKATPSTLHLMMRSSFIWLYLKAMASLLEELLQQQHRVRSLLQLGRFESARRVHWLR